MGNDQPPAQWIGMAPAKQTSPKTPTTLRGLEPIPPPSFRTFSYLIDLQSLSRKDWKTE